MKKIVKGLLVIILCLLVMTGCGKKTEGEKKPEVKTNTNQNVIKDQTVENFKFEKTSLIYENGTSVLETKVTNTSDKTEYLSEFKIHVKDASGNEIVTMTGFIGNSLEANESRTITSSYGEDLTTAASISYEIVK